VLAAVAALVAEPAAADGRDTTGAGFPVFTGFQRLDGVYEPSAAEQMPDGRIFVVEDEIDTSLAILSIEPDGGFRVARLDAAAVLSVAAEEDPVAVPEDFEGVAIDGDGWVYVVTSHSRESDGAEHPRRNQLLRFRVEGDELSRIQRYGDLKSDIAAKHPLLAKSVATLDVKNEGGFNIAGIAFDEDGDSLLVGFRSPLDEGGRAVLVGIRNPREIFDEGEKAEIDDDLVTLDLHDSGVRGIVWDPELDGYLIIAGPVSRDRTLDFSLWFWSGEGDEAARAVTIPGPPEAINRSECVSSVRVNGKRKLLLIRDDGKRKKKKGAHYIFLDYDQLSVGE
jgi:hypothetical protein